MKNTPTKIRPPRVYRTKTGRPYIKHKGKKIYLNFGKKTNEMSTLSIIKLFLKYITKKKRSGTTRKSKSVLEKPQRENREKVNMLVENYLRDKYSKINEMDKKEEQKRKEVKEQAEAKQRQELKDAQERQRDIDRAIARERKLQAELKMDRAVSQTVLRQLTASNVRIERLIEEGKNIARDVANAPRREDAPRRDAAPRREIKRAEEDDDRQVRDLGDIKVEDVTSVEEAKNAREAKHRAEAAKNIAEAAKHRAEAAKNRAEEDAKKAKEETKKSIEDAKKAKEAKKRADEDANKAREDADKSTKEAKKAREDADKSMREAENAKREAEKSMKDAKKAREESEKSMKDAQKAREEAKKAREEVKRAGEESERLEEKSKIALRNGVIESMFSEPVKNTDKSKVTPLKLLGYLNMLGYDVKEIRQKNKKLNAKETVKEFLRTHPKDFDLGDNAEAGWNNLLTKLTQKLSAYAAEEEIKAIIEEEREQEAKQEAKQEVKHEAKQEVKQEAESLEVKDSKDNKHSSASSSEEKSVDTSNDDSADGTIEEVPDQVGTGVRDACINIIGELTVGDIKKFLKRTHTDAYRKKYKYKGKLLKANYIEALMLAMADEKIRLAVCSKLNGQVGGGRNDPQKGLTTAQLDELMEDEQRYLGTVASDEIKTLKPKGNKYAFIMNTDKASQPAQHWIAVYVDLKGDKTVEVYDPLGTYEPTKEFLEQIKTLVDKANLDHYLLLKVNKIKRQSETSDTCGWFAVQFLKERFMGNIFKFSTGFTELKEDEIQKYKKQNGYGFDTYL